VQRHLNAVLRSVQGVLQEKYRKAPLIAAIIASWPIAFTFLANGKITLYRMKPVE
jgi:hypothetical protein